MYYDIDGYPYCIYDKDKPPKSVKIISKPIIFNQHVITKNNKILEPGRVGTLPEKLEKIF